MPLTLTFTEGVLTSNQVEQVIAHLTDSFLEHHGLSGNKIMTPNITAHVNITPKGLTFSGGKTVEGVWVETKTPSFALADPDIQASYFSKATQFIHEQTDRKLPKERIWTNATHAVDGSWNIDGVTLTNAGITEAISKGL